MGNENSRKDGASLVRPRTICVECVHFLNISGGFNAGVWYNHLCKAYPEERIINPVTGKNVTDSGQEYAYCRDKNSGECPKYEVLTPKVKQKTWPGSPVESIVQ